MELDKELALKALKMLDEALEEAGFSLVKMIAGGGASMLLAYGFPGKTNDIDAITTNANFDEIKILAETIAKNLGIDHDWLNPHFQSFTIYLPEDSKSRMKRIYNGSHLIVESLGPEDILIMKLMAGRAKDRSHIKYLLKMSLDISVVENRLHELQDKNLYAKLARQALDLLDEETDQEMDE